MDTKALQLIVDIARHGSFSAVARAQNLDPSSVSRTLAALEQELGARLFQRTTRNLALTDAGEAYLAKISPLVEQLEAARDVLDPSADDPTGTLRLTASVSFGHHIIVPLVPKFRETFPRLALDLVLSDANVDLLEQRIDLAVRLGSTYRGDVVGAKLMPTHFRVVASPAFVARIGLLATPDRLADHACLLFPLPEYRTRWLFRREGRTQEIPVHGEVIATSALALREFARAGLGPALLADWLIGDDLRQGSLIDLFPDHEVTATTFDTAAWLLYPSRQFLPVKVRAAIDFLRRSLAP